MINDPIADMLTRIRNANSKRHKEVAIPMSKTKEKIAAILKDEGFINDYVIKEEKPRNMIVLKLKYDESKRPALTGLKKISKPGLRVYVGADEVPKVLNGLGIAIISTSQGLMVDKAAREKNVGGEVIAYIW